jgi:hypothetical protein
VKRGAANAVDRVDGSTTQLEGDLMNFGLVDIPVR